MTEARVQHRDLKYRSMDLYCKNKKYVNDIFFKFQMSSILPPGLVHFIEINILFIRQLLYSDEIAIHYLGKRRHDGQISLFDNKLIQ